MKRPIVTANVISMSGGKDSTATALLALERRVDNARFVFADTGHEHPETLAYLDYLRDTLSIDIEVVRYDFSEKIAKKRARILDPDSDWPDHLRERALEVLHPSGNPMLDLCLWKGRFPSTMARFCTQWLKSTPIDEQITQPILASKDFSRLVSWQGVRADESPARAKLEPWAMEMGDAETGEGLWVYRPILEWSADDVFAMHRRHGIKWNPLYEQGMGRVGCMPCINARKGEIREIARRFPEEMERIAEWERIVSDAAKRGCATFWPARGETDVNLEKHGIHNIIAWSRTSRGGQQYDLEAMAEVDDEAPSCQSIYGLCE